MAETEPARGLQQTNSGQPLEKDFSQNPSGAPVSNGYKQSQYNGDSYHMNDTDMDSDTALGRIRTAGSISISPELFEKIYLSPQNVVKGDLRKTFGNPTPVAICGFLLSLSPLSCDLMGWRGAGGNGAASIGAYFFFGGLLMIIGGFLEFILGNTFPFVVFSSFGAFWLTFAATLQPQYNAYLAYATPQDSTGLMTVGYNASFGFFLLFMGLLCLIYLICSLRTNVVFFVIFLTLVIAFALLTGAFWQVANAAAGSTTAGALAAKLQTGGGATLFVTCMAGWYLLFAILLASVDFPLVLPVGDLSTIVKGASDKAKVKKEHQV